MESRTEAVGTGWKGQKKPPYDSARKSTSCWIDSVLHFSQTDKLYLYVCCREVSMLAQLHQASTTSNKASPPALSAAPGSAAGPPRRRQARPTGAPMSRVGSSSSRIRSCGAAIRAISRSTALCPTDRAVLRHRGERRLEVAAVARCHRSRSPIPPGAAAAIELASALSTPSAIPSLATTMALRSAAAGGGARKFSASRWRRSSRQTPVEAGNIQTVQRPRASWQT